MALHNHNAVTLSSAVHVRYALGSELKTDMLAVRARYRVKGALRVIASVRSFTMSA